MIITIDGPAKSGKSSSAAILAATLGYRYLNTGAMYRATGLALVDQNIALNDLAAIRAFTGQIHFDMANGNVVLNGIDYTQRSTSKEAGEAASVIGELIDVRRPLQAEQQRIAREWVRIICEGRDQGSVVFPKAAFKFYITAQPRTRAERQAKMMTGPVDLSVLEAELKKRDHRDMSRDLDPLVIPDDAKVIENDKISADDVAAMMLETIKNAQAQ